MEWKIVESLKEHNKMRRASRGKEVSLKWYHAENSQLYSAAV